MEAEFIARFGPQAEMELEGFRALAHRAEEVAVESLCTAVQSGELEEHDLVAAARARLDALVEISRNRADESAENRADAEWVAEGAMQQKAMQLVALDEALAQTARLREEKAACEAAAKDMHRRIDDRQAEVNSFVAKRNKAIADREYAEKWCWIPFYGLYLAIDYAVQDYGKKAQDAEEMKCSRESDLRVIVDNYDRCDLELRNAERKVAEEVQCQQAMQDRLSRIQDFITELKQAFALWDNLFLYYLSLVTRFETKLLDRRGLQRELKETGTISITI